MISVNICWLLRPPTAVFSYVHSQLNYLIKSSNYLQNAFWHTGSQSLVKNKTIGDEGITVDFELSKSTE